MSTDSCQPAAPAHDRGHERAQALCRHRRGATSTAASGSLHFSSGRPTRPQRRTSAGFSCTWPRRALSICNRNRIMTGVRFLLRVTLRRLDLAAEIYLCDQTN